MKPLLIALFLTAGTATAPAIAQDTRAATASGQAWAEVSRAVSQDGILHVELRFLTDRPAYPGERIYDDIPADRLNAMIYVMKGDQSFPLWLEDGKAMVPDRLELRAGDGPQVGHWQADFVAPHHDVTEAFLHLPNLAPVGPFRIERR